MILAGGTPSSNWLIIVTGLVMVNYLRHAESLYFLESNAVESPHRTRSSKPVKDASSKDERGPNELTSTHLTELLLLRKRGAKG